MRFLPINFTLPSDSTSLRAKVFLSRLSIALAAGAFSILPAPMFAGSPQAQRTLATIAPQELRVEMVADPIGVDIATPRLSWKLRATQQSAHDLSQSAFRLIVATSPQLLAFEKGDVWDTGRVTSEDFSGIPFGGSPLHSHTTYFWRVRVWDQSGKQSKWSDTAKWTTALLQLSDWSAKWIAAEPDGPLEPQALEHAEKWVDDTKPLPIFRHDFRLDKPIKEAVVYVSGLGQYELRLNGKNITDTVLNPGWTNYRKTALYNSYDLTSMLHGGLNTFGVLLGNGMYDVPGVRGRYTKFVGSFGQPKLILQMHVTYTDGSHTTITSDRGWKTTTGPIIFSSTFGGEDFDAGKEPTGWDMPGFQDAAWSPALEVTGPNGNPANPYGVLSSHILPEIRVMHIFKPQKITEPKPGIRVYDLGQNFAGWPSITVRGKAGDRIRMLPGELLDSNGLVTQASAGAGANSPVIFSYVLKGGGTEHWHPRFSYYGFRYVQVETITADGAASQNTNVISLDGNFTHDAVTQDGTFTSSLPLLRNIHRLIDMAILSNLASVITDCPHREKLGWLEQTHLAGTSIMYNYGVRNLYGKMADDMVAAQLPDGLIPSIAPEYVAFVDSDGMNTNFRDSPEWGSAIILSPWTAYQFYGDRDVLEKHYDAMRQYARYLNTKAQNHILLFGLGDWYDIGPRSPGESQLTAKGLTATAIYYQDLTVLARIARMLHRGADAVQYANEAALVKDAFNQSFLHPETGNYDQGSQTANAIALALGIVPEEYRAAVLENLVKDIRTHGNHVTAGDIGFHYVVRALTDGDRSDVLYDMVSRKDSPGYGDQLAKGATTLTEAWDANPRFSQNHFMLGHVEEWFYRGLAGIDVDFSRPKGQQIIIRPAMIASVPDASSKFQSILGTVMSSWKRTRGTLTLDVGIPPGTRATIYLPSGEDVLMNGKVLKHAGAENATVSGSKVISVVVGSGRFHFAISQSSGDRETDVSSNHKF